MEASKKKILTSCLRNVVLASFAAGMLFCQVRISCSSDGGRRVCPADTRSGVVMVKQRSGSPCVQGRTWGFDRGGIWVDRGCRADFALGNVSDNRPGRPGFGGGQPFVQNITCSSDDGKRHWCAVQRNGDTRLVRQISGSPCRRGYSWDTTPGSVWVDKGCRADFEVRASR